MRLLLSFSLVVAAIGAPSLVFAQKNSETGMVCTPDGLPCRFWMPDGYDATKPYPLVVYLHGAGQAGTDNKKHVDEWNDVLNPLLSASTRKTYPAFIVAPQAPSVWVDWAWEKGSYDINAVPESATLKKVLATITALRGQYNVDPNRLYVVGYSMGGEGTWDLVARHPDMFAGALPVFGVAAPNAAPRLRNTAVWAFHNADDGSVRPDSDRQMFRAMAAAGARPLYTEGATGGHFGFSGYGNAAVLPWLFLQRRGVPATMPPHLVFAPASASVASPPTISLTSSLTNAQIRYTTDGTVPTATTGMAYAAPFMLQTSTVVIATAVSGTSTIHHAEPYVVGGAPLPDGAALGPQDAGAVTDVAPSDVRFAASDGSSGGAADVRDAGVPPMAGKDGSPLPPGSTSPGSTPPPGTAPGAADGSSAGGEAVAPPGKKAADDGGCSCSLQGQPGVAAPAELLLALLFAPLLVLRRRQRK